MIHYTSAILERDGEEIDIDLEIECSLYRDEYYPYSLNFEVTSFKVLDPKGIALTTEEEEALFERYNLAWLDEICMEIEQNRFTIDDYLFD